MPSTQSDAVARRFAQLSAELSAARELGEQHTRPRLSPSPPHEPPPAPPAPVPVPGRHAARRRRPWPEVLPETMRGRVRFGPGPVAVVAVLVAVGLAFTAWWVLRSGSEEVPVPIAAPPDAAGPSNAVTPLVDPAEGAPQGQGAAGGTEVVVDVAGKVRKPGIVVLDPGARVVDALKAAGGARRGVRLTSLNLARPLVDGEQILVGQPAPAPVAGGEPATGGATPGGSLVSLNSATATELEALPEVGPVTAEAILAWREENGAFTAVEELLEVDGIGDATLEQIAPHVTL